MALRDLNFSSSHVATATIATVAPERAIEVAKVAPVAVAEPQDSKNVLDPKALCPACGGGQWWQPQGGGAWHCRRCKSDMPATATTLTLPCHQPPQPLLVRTHTHLEPLLECACEDLTITPEQLRQALEDTDLPALASGELTLKALRLTARALALAHNGLLTAELKSDGVRY
jgi:ribosomal protein L37AE/L43A